MSTFEVGDHVRYAVPALFLYPAYEVTGVVVKQRVFKGLHQLLVRQDGWQLESIVGVELITHVNGEAI